MFRCTSIVVLILGSLSSVVYAADGITCAVSLLQLKDTHIAAKRPAIQDYEYDSSQKPFVFRMEANETSKSVDLDLHSAKIYGDRQMYSVVSAQQNPIANISMRRNEKAINFNGQSNFAQFMNFEFENSQKVFVRSLAVRLTNEMALLSLACLRDQDSREPRNRI